MALEAPRAAVGDAPRARQRRRVLSPVERLSEVLFGLIMVLSITGSISVAEADRDDVHRMLIGAVGCNTAWGIVDAVMYLMATLLERQRGRSLFTAIRDEPDPIRARRAILAELPPLVAGVIPTTSLERMRQALSALAPPPRAGLTRADLAGAAGVFLLVFGSTLPVVTPFLLPLDARRALRVSNAVAIAMLFVVGLGIGKYLANRPLLMGISMVAVGVVLVGITMALGG